MTLEAALRAYGKDPADIPAAAYGNDAAAYVEVYAEAAGASRDAVFAWLPFVAAARIAEGVAEETDRLMAMADTL